MNDKMTSNSNLKERIKYVSKIVATWPKWKQDLLGYPIRKRGKQMSDKMTDAELVERVAMEVLKFESDWYALGTAFRRPARMGERKLVWWRGIETLEPKRRTARQTITLESCR